MVTDRTNPGSSARTAVVWDALRTALAARSAELGRPGLDVVDLGGGTGGFAVPLARLGHRVTVVDPSPDALAALERRSAEAGLGARPARPEAAAGGSVRALQGDLASVFEVAEPGAADAVLCHGVLEFVDDPAEGCRAAARLLRPGGLVSVLAANRDAAVLARALAGHVDEALAALTDPQGRFGAHDPVPRRFDEAALRALLEQAGLAVRSVHGVRIFADLVAASVGEAQGPGGAGLLALEAAASELPGFRAVATQLHLLADLATPAAATTAG